VFVNISHFYPSVLFVGKAEAYQSWALCNTSR